MGYIYAHLSNEFWGYEEHPIYISLYLGISLILISFNFHNSHLKIGLFIIILSTIIFLLRKGNILGLLIIFVFVLINKPKIFFHKKAIKFWIFLFLVAIIGFYTLDNFILSRFNEIIDFKLIDKGINTSTGIRTILWKESLELSLNSPFFGYGLGSVQDTINNSLIKSGHLELTVGHTYNAHNQFLQFILTFGYIGFVLVFLIFAYIFKVLRKSGCTAGIYIFLYILMCFFTESILERQNGIITVAMFLNLLLFVPKENTA